MGIPRNSQVDKEKIPEWVKRLQGKRPDTDIPDNPPPIYDYGDQQPPYEDDPTNLQNTEINPPFAVPRPSDSQDSMDVSSYGKTDPGLSFQIGPQEPSSSNTARDRIVSGAAQGVADKPPPLVNYNEVGSSLDAQIARAEHNRLDVLNANGGKPQHQNPWLQGLWWALQGIQKFANPNDKTPVVGLGTAKRDAQIREADKRLAPLYEQRNIQNKNALDSYKVAGERADATIKRLKAIQEQNPKLFETIMSDQVITKEEADAAYQAGYGVIIPGDYRRFKYDMVNGTPVSTPEVGPPRWAQDNRPIDYGKTETPIISHLEDGTPYITTGNKQAGREATVEAGKARAAQIIQNKTTEVENKNAEKTREAELQNSKIERDKNSLIGQAKIEYGNYLSLREESLNLQSQAEKLRADRRADPNDAIKLENQAKEKMTKATEAFNRHQAIMDEANSMKPAPPAALEKPPILATPKKPTKTVTLSEIQEIMKLTGKSKSDILKMMEDHPDYNYIIK